MIGIGVTSYNRLDALDKCLDSIKDINGWNTVVYVHDDASEDKQRVRKMIREYDDFRWVAQSTNKGVATAKNTLLAGLLFEGCEWIFLIEDDMLVNNTDVFGAYIDAAEAGMCGHLNFHCPAAGLNLTPIETFGKITLWPHLAGTFSLYSRESLLSCGLMLEALYNAWEHVEHTQRLALKGFTTTFPVGNADMTGSELYLELQDVPSVCGNDKPEHRNHIENQKLIWQLASPDTYDLVRA